MSTTITPLSAPAATPTLRPGKRSNHSRICAWSVVARGRPVGQQRQLAARLYRQHMQAVRGEHQDLGQTPGH
jgi:hypothetical protein